MKDARHNIRYEERNMPNGEGKGEEGKIFWLCLSFEVRQSTSITVCVRWSVGRSVGRLVCLSVGNAFVRRSTRRTLLAYLALLS